MSSINTGIEWTDKTWNPTTGCDKVSPGCIHCYAEAITKRFPKTFKNGFDLTLYPERLKEPSRWRTPSRIFVNSMSDLFHKEVPLDFIQAVFEVIQDTPLHIYQILTKRPERLVELAPHLKFHKNIWLGVSVENQSYVSRIDLLRQVPANVRFLSCEPLLSSLKLDLTDINWVIVGGESGPSHRPMKIEWAEDIRDQCQQAQVAFFFKQVGGKTPKSGGNLLSGQLLQQMPEAWKEHQSNWIKQPKQAALFN
jgi:protein gp37